MGLLSDIGDFFTGRDPEKYKADPNASSMQGAYGSTSALQGAMNGALGRQGPLAQAANAGPASTTTAAGLDLGRYGGVAGQQQGLAGMLTAAANGQGPSGAGLAAQAQRDSALSQASALQAGRRGQSAVAGARMGTLAAQMGNQQASQNEAIGRANEMATARGQLGSVLGGMAGQELGIAGQNAGFQQQAGMFNAGQRQNMGQFNAGLQQQTNLANQAANLQQQGLNQSLFGNSAGQLQGESQAEMAARMQQEQMKYGNLDPGSQGFLNQALGVGTTLGAAALMSDIGAKQDVQRIGGSAQLMGIGQRIVPVARTASERAGDAVMGGLQGLANLYLAKKLGDASRRDQDAKEARDRDAAYRDAHPGGAPPPLDFGSPRPAPQPTEPPAYDEPLEPERDLGFNTAPTGRPYVSPLTLGAQFSDERSKASVNDLGPDLVQKKAARDMLDRVQPYSYEYTDRAKSYGAPEGRQVGVMAQDLQRSDAGRELVQRDPASGYLTVDYAKAAPTMMAGLADIEQRLSRLEGRPGRSSLGPRGRR